MPLDTLEKPEQDTNNPGDRHWDNEFNGTTGTKDLQDLEKNVDGGQQSKTNSGLGGKDFGAAARTGEQTNGSWANNTSKQAPKSNAKQNTWGKTKAFFKKKGATITIVALLGGGAAVPFFGSATLLFAMLGNMDAKSMMRGLENYMDDYNGFRVFGSKKASVQNGTGGKIAGLTKTEIAELQKNGVQLRGGKTNSITKKTTFTGVKIEGGKWINAGSAFDKEKRNNPAFRKAMKFNKGSYWKSAKSAAAANTRALLEINPNPDLEGKTTEEKNQKLQKASVNDAGTDITTKVNAGEDDGDSEKVQTANAEVEGIAEGLQEEIDELKAQISEGEVSESIAADSNKGNIATQFDKEVLDVVDSVKGPGGKIWGYVNTLDAVDTVCTTYQVAHTAMILARGVVVANWVRFAMTFRASLEKTKVGDDTDGTANYLMDILNKRDPTTNQAFDSSPYASYLFTGKLSSEPGAVSALGGQSLVSLAMGLHALHQYVGMGSAGTGRSILKNGCQVATNLGVQIVATVGSLAAGIFSGGATVIAQGAFSAGVKVGLKNAKEFIINKMIKEYGKKIIKEMSENIAEQGAVKYFSRTAWNGFKTAWKTMSPVDKIGVLIAGVSTFGMAYIVDSLSGADIAGATSNGVTAVSGIGTGWNQYELVNGVANGGSIPTYAQATAYKTTQTEYEQRYIADMQYEAKDTPLDATNPYSTLGAAVFGAQKVVGLSASTNIFSTLSSVATLPLKLPGFTASAAGGDPTPEAIGELIGDPFMTENKIAQTVTGSPQVQFDKTLTFEQFIEQFIDTAAPQVTYDGDDETTGEPKFSVIPGSQLAEYQERCRNPARTGVDPQFAYDDNSNYYDMNECSVNRNAGFDDAIRFIYQVGPDVSSSTDSGGATDTTGAIVDVGPNASGAQTPWGGYKNGEIPESAMTKIPIADACSTGYGANSPLRAYLHPKATIAVVELNNRYKAKFGRDMYFKGCYRPLSEQQRAWNNEPPGNAARPGTSNHGWGLAIDFAISASQSMTYGSEEYKWLMNNAYKVGWVNPPSMRASGSGPHEPWHWEYAGSTETGSSP